MNKEQYIPATLQEKICKVLNSALPQADKLEMIADVMRLDKPLSFGRADDRKYSYKV